MEDFLKEIKALVNNLEKYDGKPIVVDNVQVAGTTAEKIDLPLRNRLAATDEEAMNRARMEANKHGEQMEDDSNEHDDEIAEMHADDVIEKLMRGFNP